MSNAVLPKTDATVHTGSFFSHTLGVEKKYKIYLPPNYYVSDRRYPVLYLFRGHENEWFDPYQDHSRGGRAVQHLADELIRSGAIGEMIIVGVSMTSDDGHVFGLGVNFLNPKAAAGHSGVGNGRFEDYFIEDLIPYIDKTYRTRTGRAFRGADGFSLGGYLSVMMAVKHPELFCSVGSYDGSHMFHNLDDPRHDYGGPDDFLWFRKDDMFAPAFRKSGKKKYDTAQLLKYNPLNIIEKHSDEQKILLRSTRFYITSAAFDDSQGNRDRNVHLITLLHLHGIYNHVPSLILSTDAHHNWKFADLHLRETLKKHSEAFGIPRTATESSVSKEYLPNVEIISVEDATHYEQPVKICYRVYREVPVKVEILNYNGASMATVRLEMHECGRHTVTWDGRNEQGHRVASGIYFVQISTELGTIRQKFLFLR
ncbi:MAG: alpha/beta hydrolase-fold protein [Calditrichia bacterium]|nr:hypothetical protein [Calditrichota bacterium]MCB0268148.1 hypothetical protein [Calditrichota bacterium]MCB9068461.1 hypothetical protein [Calditrichia bacterium]